MRAKINDNRIKSELESDMETKIREFFEQKIKQIKIDATLELCFLDDFPIIGEYVYGEAYPSDKLIKLDVFAPYATKKKTVSIICEELMHIKHPELHHGKKFWKLVRELVNEH